jgi:hypothetical protein
MASERPLEPDGPRHQPAERRKIVTYKIAEIHLYRISKLMEDAHEYCLKVMGPAAPMGNHVRLWFASLLPLYAEVRKLLPENDRAKLNSQIKRLDFTTKRTPTEVVGEVHDLYLVLFDHLQERGFKLPYAGEEEDDEPSRGGLASYLRTENGRGGEAAPEE